MSDHDIAQQVRGLLATLLDDFDAVKVEVEGGVAYLEGVAATPALRQRIEQAVLRLPNVCRVVNCLAHEHVALLHNEGGLPVFTGDALHYIDGPAPRIEQSRG